MKKTLFIRNFQISNSIVAFFPTNDVIILINDYVFVREGWLSNFDSGFPYIAFVPLEFQQKMFPETHLPDIPQNTDALSKLCDVLNLKIHNEFLDWLLVVKPIQECELK